MGVRARVIETCLAILPQNDESGMRSWQNAMEPTIVETFVDVFARYQMLKT